MPVQDMYDPTTGLGIANQAQADALTKIFGLGAGALALGAGARGLSGLGSFFGRNLMGPPRTPARQSFIRIPVPVGGAEEEEEEEPRILAKAAAHDKLATLAQGAADLLGLARRAGEGVGSTFGGWGETAMSKMPWAVPAAGAATLGGLYGGWKLTDYLLDKTRNMEQESELEAARKEYEKALGGRYKRASAASPLDALAGLYEKRALLPELLGGGLLLGGGIAGLSGLGAYDWTRSVAQDKALEEAVKRRQFQLAEQAPSPMMAIPMPVRPPRRRRKPPKREKSAANVGQAADQFLGRIKNNQMAVWQRLMTPADAKPAKPPAKQEQAPPQLPTLAGSWDRMRAQPPVRRPQPA